MRHKSLAESARLFRIVVVMIMVSIGAVYLINRFGLSLGHYLRVENRLPDGGWNRIISDVAVFLFLAALFDVVRLLGRLADGDLFSPKVTGAFRGFARWLVLAALVSIIGPLFVALAARTDSGDGPIQIALRFDLREILFMVAAFVIFLVARVLDTAAQIDSDLKEIV